MGADDRRTRIQREDVAGEGFILPAQLTHISDLNDRIMLRTRELAPLGRTLNIKAHYPHRRYLLQIALKLLMIRQTLVIKNIQLQLISRLLIDPRPHRIRPLMYINPAHTCHIIIYHKPQRMRDSTLKSSRPERAAHEDHALLDEGAEVGDVAGEDRVDLDEFGLAFRVVHDRLAFQQFQFGDHVAPVVVARVHFAVQVVLQIR